MALGARIVDAKNEGCAPERLVPLNARTAGPSRRGGVAEEEPETRAAHAGNDAPAFRFAVDVLERLPDVWRAAPVEARDALAGSIWPAGLVFDGARFRTPENDDLIGLLGGVRAENSGARRAEAAGRPVWGG